MTRLFRSYGYFSGDYMESFLDGLLAAKRANKARGCTFQQLWEERRVELRVGAANVTTGKFEFLDRQSAPLMPVAQAVRASSSIPFVFTPTTYAGHTYVDGCTEAKLPITAFPGKRTLAFHLLSAERGERGGLQQHMRTIGDMMMNAAQRKHGINFNSCNSFAHESMFHLRRKNVECVMIDCSRFGVLNTKMTRDDVEEMLQAGRAAAAHYLSLQSPARRDLAQEVQEAEIALKVLRRAIRTTQHFSHSSPDLRQEVEGQECEAALDLVENTVTSLSSYASP